jgi:hypothetical protein
MVLRRADEGSAHLGHLAIAEIVVERASTDAVARFQNDHRATRALDS